MRQQRDQRTAPVGLQLLLTLDEGAVATVRIPLRVDGERHTCADRRGAILPADRVAELQDARRFHRVGQGDLFDFAEVRHVLLAHQHDALVFREDLVDQSLATLAAVEVIVGDLRADDVREVQQLGRFLHGEQEVRVGTRLHRRVHPGIRTGFVEGEIHQDGGPERSANGIDASAAPGPDDVDGLAEFEPPTGPENLFERAAHATDAHAMRAEGHTQGFVHAAYDIAVGHSREHRQIALGHAEAGATHAVLGQDGLEAATGAAHDVAAEGLAEGATGMVAAAVRAHRSFTRFLKTTHQVLLVTAVEGAVGIHY